MDHTITLQPSGHRFSCDGDTKLLQAGLDQGLGLPFSCRSGVCRTCRGRIVSGQVDFGAVHPTYLNQADMDRGFVHLCQAKPLADCVIEIAEIAPGSCYPVQSMPVRVLSMERAAADVMVVALGVPANEPVRFHAGQYLEVIGGKVGARESLKAGLRRAYSIANAPVNDGLRQIELHIRHMPGGAFTDSVFSSMKVRDMLRVEVPMGSFSLDETSAQPIVMLASGTGFAPIKAMVERSIAQGARRPIRLYWGGRCRTDLYMDGLARQWAAAHPHITYIPVLSEPTAACGWTGATGYVHLAVLDDLPDLSGYQVYACGAPLMVDAARRDFTTRAGLPAAAFFADAFVSEADKAR